MKSMLKGAIAALALAPFATSAGAQIDPVARGMAAANAPIAQPPAAQGGQTTTRKLGFWLNDVAQARSVSRFNGYPLNTSLVSSPPTFGLGFGLYTVAVGAAGTGYVTGDTVTLAGATCTTAPVVTVTATSGAVTAVAIKVPGVCSATAMSFTQASTSGTGTGATFTGTMQVYAAASMASPVRSYINASSTPCRLNMVEPRQNISSTGYYGSASAYIGTAATVECDSDAPQIDFDILAFNTNLDLLMDGQRVNNAQLTTDSSGSGWVLTLKPTTPGVHNYRISGVDLGVAAVVVGTGYSVWTPQAKRPPLVIVVGDSYTYGTCAQQTFLSWSQVMANARGVEVLNDGIGGTGWNSTGTSLPSTRISNDIALRTQIANATEIDFALGYNDAAGSMTTLTTNLNAAVAAVRAINPALKIVFIGPWTPLGPTANLTTVSNAISAAAAALGLPFVDPVSIINSSNSTLYGCGDNVHPGTGGVPSAAGSEAKGGHVFLGNHVADLLGAVN